MKYILLALVLVFAIMPTYVFAVCSDTGSTVVFVNGILNSETDAKQSMKFLREAFQEKFGDADVKFIVGYNPSHLAGIGDLAQAGAQMLGGSVSDFDLKTILMQIQPEVTTRKILLVGHSQGTLYTNSMYQYLIAHGVPKESIAVYNVATPARETAGGGKYLTSSNDSLIGALASLAQKAGLPAPMLPNIDIPIQPGDRDSAYPGHNFIRAYLPGASDKIISDVSLGLGALRAEESAETCFTAPPSTIGYKIEGALFAFADPVAIGAVSAAKTAARAEMAAGEFLGNAIVFAGGKIKNAATALLAFSDGNLAPQARSLSGESESNSAVPPPSSDLDVGRLSEPPDSSTSDVGTSLTSDVFPSGGEDFPSPYEGEGAQSAGEVNGKNMPPFLQLQSVGGGSVGFGGGSPVSPSSTSGVLTSSTPDVIPGDTTAPDIALNISECPGLAAVAGECLVASSTVNISWSSAADDLDHFIFNSASTTATSTVYTFSEDGTLIFEVKAVDKAGNESAATKEVVFSARPVVINEVAWAGTSASASDEWIELYNRSSRNVSLAGWVLYAQDGVPYLNLSGTISAGGYYLIERTDDSAVSDVTADLIAPFSGTGAGSGLGNSGETLVLSYASTTIDQNVLCSAAWCGGSAATTYKSMERIDPDVAGTDAVNWGTSSGIVKNGLDSAGSQLTATPRARNSLHYLIAQGTMLLADRTLKQSFGTYIIKENDTLIVPAGKTLTIEAGVTVKMGGSASLEVNGTLVANGTSANNIVFTSLSSTPAGDWKNIRITSTSQNSSICYTKFKYGGSYFSNTPLEQRSELSVINNSITISNSIFEHSYGGGLRLTVSNSTVTGNTFSVGTTSSSNVGLEASTGSPTISQNTFSENYQGLRLNTDTAASAQNNTFTNNSDYAVYSVNATSTFSGNSGSGNGKNGIALSGTIAAVGGTTTLSANSLPYLIGRYPYENPKIAAGSVLVVGAGVIWKGEASNSRFEVEGTMKLEGASKDSILFTSLADPPAGGPGGWYGITVSSTGYVYGGGFTLKYGGGSQSCSGCAGFSVIGGRVNLSEGRIQNNYKVGMQFYDSATSTLSNFEFLDHQTPSDNSTALVSSNSTLILDNLTFSNNQTNTSPPGLY